MIQARPPGSLGFDHMGAEREDPDITKASGLSLTH